MRSKIVARIEAEAGLPGLFEALRCSIPPSDLQSLLLETYRARTQTVRESEVVARVNQSALTQPSNVDARLLHRFDSAALAAARAFEAVALSPVCPLGANFVLGHTDQNNVLTTIRNSEVLGDPTIALAIECARRRRTPAQRVPGSEVRLASSHRVIRLQPVDFPGFSPHFQLFGMVSAGRDSGSQRFELAHLEEHIRVYLTLFRILNGQGFQFSSPLVEIADLSITEALMTQAGVSRDELRAAVHAHDPDSGRKFLHSRGIVPAGDSSEGRLQLVKQQMFKNLAAEFPEARFSVNLSRLEGLGYYAGLALRISPEAADGKRYPIADGGFTDWTARLIGDRKERLLISGIGSEFTCRKFAVNA